MDMSNINARWSKRLLIETEQACLMYEFVPGHPQGLCLKSLSGEFGYIRYEDVLKRQWVIHSHDDDRIVRFESYDEMIRQGWALD